MYLPLTSTHTHTHTPTHTCARTRIRNYGTHFTLTQHTDPLTFWPMADPQTDTHTYIFPPSLSSTSPPTLCSSVHPPASSLFTCIPYSFYPQFLPLPLTFTLTDTPTYTHIHTHNYTQTDTHTHTPSHTHAYTHFYISTLSYTFTHMHTNIHIHAYTYIPNFIHSHTPIHTPFIKTLWFYIYYSYFSIPSFSLGHYFIPTHSNLLSFPFFLSFFSFSFSGQ